MKYGIDFQFLRKGAARPTDDGAVVDVQTDDQGFALVPNIGDHVLIQNSPDHGGASFKGIVRSRLFMYFEGKVCTVNIVVEEVDDNDFAALIKS